MSVVSVPWLVTAVLNCLLIKEQFYHLPINISGTFEKVKGKFFFFDLSPKSFPIYHDPRHHLGLQVINLPLQNVNLAVYSVIILFGTLVNVFPTAFRDMVPFIFELFFQFGNMILNRFVVVHYFPQKCYLKRWSLGIENFKTSFAFHVIHQCSEDTNLKKVVFINPSTRDLFGKPLVTREQARGNMFVIPISPPVAVEHFVFVIGKYIYDFHN